MINETILPNPFKQAGAELTEALDAIERDLDGYQAERLPSFLTDAFLLKLESEIIAAGRQNAERKLQGLRIINKLRTYWPRS